MKKILLLFIAVLSLFSSCTKKIDSPIEPERLNPPDIGSVYRRGEYPEGISRDSSIFIRQFLNSDSILVGNYDFYKDGHVDTHSGVLLYKYLVDEQMIYLAADSENPFEKKYSYHGDSIIDVEAFNADVYYKVK